MAATLAVNDKKRHIFIPLGVRAKPYSQGVHLILLYYIRISLLSAETFFFILVVGGGWWPLEVILGLWCSILIRPLENNFGPR